MLHCRYRDKQKHKALNAIWCKERKKKKPFTVTVVRPLVWKLYVYSLLYLRAFFRHLLKAEATWVLSPVILSGVINSNNSWDETLSVLTN